MRIQFLVFLIPLMAIVFAFVYGGRHSACARSRHRSHRHNVSPPRPAPSRFLPGFITGVLGSFVVVGAIVFMHRMTSPITVTTMSPIPVRHRAVNTYPRVSDVEPKQLLEDVNGQGATRPTPIPVAVPRESEENVSFDEPETDAFNATDELSLTESLTVTLFEPGATEGERAAKLPEWTSRTDESEGLPRVIESGPHATVADAQAESVSLLGVQLVQAFVRQHPEAAGWTPREDIIRSTGVIGRRAIQESEVTVGEFTEPVFQAFLEVVPSATIEPELFAAWRAETLQSRLLLVGGALGLLTLLFGSLAGYFHVDAATRGKYRK